MNNILRERERYIKRKLSHLLFEILEFPEKKDVLYIGLCYCQLSRIYGLDEIPLEGLKKCLNKYLIDFDSYPWRDYLLELELFYLRDEGDKFIKGSGLITYNPSGESFLSIDPRYGFLKQNFCQKVYRYWYISQKWENFSKPLNGWEVIENAIRLFNEGLYGETIFYLEDYLPYLNEKRELLMFRILKTLAIIGELIEKNERRKAIKELISLREFIGDFKPELRELPYNFKKLNKDLKKLEKQLKKSKRSIYTEPIRLERKRKNSLLDSLKKIFIWLLSD
ncbi:MAG TPA: hypothetical protein EYO62_03035 [Aquificales bacterium]|nr:hypothetical protein [Aquificales bacterium]